MDRALPRHMIDLIHDGVTGAELKGRGDRAVYGALKSTAASAIQRGWSYPDWADLVMDPQRELGRQAQLKNGRPRGKARTEEFLKQVWSDAAVFVKKAPPPFTRVQAGVEAGRRYELAMLAVADLDRPLSPSQRAVLEYVARCSSERDTLRIAMPRREVMKACGLGTTAARKALDSLCRLGYLELVEKGRPAKDEADRRANVYAVAAELPAIALSPVPETGKWCPPALSSGVPAPTTDGAPALVSGAPLSINTDDGKEHAVITLTYSPDGEVTVTLPGATPKEVIDAVQARRLQVVVAADDLTDSDGTNVTPLFEARVPRSARTDRSGAS